MSPDKFKRRMDAVASMMQSNAENLMVKTALTVHATVVLGTPVDTGRARASWRVAIGAPAEGTADPNKYRTKDDSGKATAESMAAARQALARYGTSPAGQRITLRSVLLGTRQSAAIHITNNLPYIQRLNEGYSKQAPAMFVETAMAAAAAQVRKTNLTTGINVRIG